MDSIKIEDYLQNRQPNKTGTCKQCGKQIPWNRQKLGNHKRSGNCLGQSKQEQNMFKSLNTNSTIFIGNQPESTFTESNPKRHKPNWIDSTTEEQKKHYDQKCARFIFENCLPFSVVESPSFKDFVKSIRPSYNPPTRKKVAGPLLLDEYEELKTSVKEKIEKARYVNLVSDGWSNMRNEHVVNFIILIPNEETPIYFKSLFTADIRQTGENIATEIIRVIEEIGPDKVVSVVTDNAPNMTSAWTIIETNFPKIFANGCAAHVLNLLIKDLCSAEKYQNVMVKANNIVNYVKRRHIAFAKFEEIRTQLTISRTLCQPVETRWYSQYECLKSVIMNRDTLSLLGNINDIFRNNETDKRFLSDIHDIDFWNKAIELRDVLGTPTSLIGKFEKNDCRLSEIYNSFRELEKLQNSNDFFKKCVRDRWNFLHTESMGWSYLLNPSTEGGSGMVGNDRRETITQLKKFITVFFDIEEEKVLCTRELNTYLTNFEFSQKEADIEDPLTWWSIYGKEEFPNLSKIAIRVQQVPTSSAASERAWSIFARIHNKIRNRLMNERVHQLAYVCINKQLRSNYDVNNDNFDF